LTPSKGGAVGDVHATRRGGARHELSSRVLLTSTAPSTPPQARATLEGWALNVSRGGVRVILEEKVELGAEFEVALTEAGGGAVTASRIGRVVWVQEEPDGVVAGIEFRGDTPVPKAGP
jgi:hypothetical protein